MSHVDDRICELDGKSSCWRYVFTVLEMLSDMLTTNVNFLETHGVDTPACGGSTSICRWSMKNLIFTRFVGRQCEGKV